MNRPLNIWLVFTGCLALLLGAMGWVTWHTLRLEREREATAQEAAKQERVRLALWRLDFQASTLVIRENARPPEDFRAFHAPEGFFNKDNTEVKKGEVLAPSPLLSVPPELVLLHFQFDGQGRAVSPQAPSGNARTLALDNYMDVEDIQRAESRLNELRALLAKPGNGARLGVPTESDEGKAHDARKSGVAALTNGQMLCAWNFSANAPLPAVLPAPGNDDMSLPQQRQSDGNALGNNVQQGYFASNSYENVARAQAVQSQKVETLPQPVQMKGKAYAGRNEQKLAESKASEAKQQQESLAKVNENWEPKELLADAKKKEAAAAKGDSPEKDKPRPLPRAMSPGSSGGARPDKAMEKQMADAPAEPAPARPQPLPQMAQTEEKSPTLQPPAQTPAMPASPPVPQVAGAQPVAQAPALLALTAPTAPVASAKPLQGFWIENTLLLTREATLDGMRVLQGAWLDWPKLRAQWLAQVSDLFPGAALEPAPNALPNQQVQDDPLRLASLPVRLVTGSFEVPPLTLWTPMRTSLAIAWMCMGLAAVAVGLVLFGTVSLSERRAAFVSAVTHELRTPLTTFRLYSEMLADDMVKDEAQRRHYLGTLEAEAGRLSHLVENVLTYARIERGSARAQVERVAIGDILDRVLPRLKQRADQAGMQIAVEATPSDRAVLLRVDVSALEQILFNLVDNACKYAAPRAADKTIHLQATTSGPLAMLRVRDYGAGIAPQERRRVFRPFHKSADQAAHSAPGVGLGLALCERLSRALGGKLSLEKMTEKGASFVLELPKAG